MIASVSSRHHAMKSFPLAFAVKSASIALQNGEVCRAVELLEQGLLVVGLRWRDSVHLLTPSKSTTQEL